MLTGVILASNSTLNNFTELDGLSIIRGSEVNLQLRLQDADTEHRYIPDAAAVITITLNDGSTGLEKTMTMNADDRSMLSVTLTEAETELILSGDIKITVDESGVTKKGLMVDALRMIDEDC